MVVRADVDAVADAATVAAVKLSRRILRPQQRQQPLPRRLPLRLLQLHHLGDAADVDVEDAVAAAADAEDVPEDVVLVVPQKLR